MIHHVRYLFFFIFIPTIVSRTPLDLSPTISFKPENNDLLLKVVKETQTFSRIPFIYISNHSQNRSLFSLVHLHHEESIPIIIGHGKIVYAHPGPKIVLFTLADCSDIFSLILSSIEESKVKPIPLLSENKQVSCKNDSFLTHTSSKLPNYCIDYVEGSTTTRHGSTSKSCDIVVNVTETDLQPGLEMSDSLFEHARGVFQHPVWNAENYLIFAIPSESPANHLTDYIHCDLFFTFKFIWRLYQGFTTVICIGQECFRYDPFRGAIDLYTLESDAYFSLYLPDLKGQEVRAAMTSQVELFEKIIFLKNWYGVVNSVMKTVVKRMGGVLFETGLPDDVREDISKALKRDINVMIFESSLTETDSRQFDVITLLDHGQISFIVPDSGFMPSYLTPAKCFSVRVWFFILIVFILFIIVHELYKRLSAEMYSEAAKGISTAFTIFSYSICVGQSRLLLNSATGRILFTVFTFSFMILSTAFLSLMTTFFSERVRYTPVDTLNDLQDSDLIFQIVLPENSTFSFMDDPKYEWLKERFSDSMDKSLSEFKYADSFVFYVTDTDELLQIGEYWNVSKFTVRGITERIDTIIGNDGFIVFLPYSAKKHDLISVTSAFKKLSSHDFHIVKESVMSYPYNMFLMKGSVYGDKIKAYVAGLVEAGILEEIYEINTIPETLRTFRQFEDDKNAPPKPFNMADLRLPFIILIVGNTLSSFVFMFELLHSV